MMSTFQSTNESGTSNITPLVDDGADVHLRILFKTVNGTNQYALHDDVTGTDVALGNADFIFFTGSSGRDFLTNETAVRLIAYGGDGDDEIYGGSGADTLWGQAGNDKLYGRDGVDTLYGGAQTDSDQLFGGLGDDRFFVRSKDSDPNVSPAVNPVKDKHGVDAIVRMVDTTKATPALSTNWAAKSWSDAEIDTVDSALGPTLEEIGNNRWMQQANGGDIKLYRLGAPTDTSKAGTLAGYGGSGNMYFPDGTFTNTSFSPQATILHEVGHFWDDSSENSHATAFQQLSRWTQNPTGPVNSYDFWKDFYSIFLVDDYIPASSNNGWYFWSASKFARGYGASSPYEDFSTVVESYFGPKYFGDTGYTTVQPKIDNLLSLFNDLKQPTTPTDLKVNTPITVTPTFTWDTLVGDYFHVNIYDAAHNLTVSRDALDFKFDFNFLLTTVLAPGRYNIQVQAFTNDGKSSEITQTDFTVPRVVPVVDTLEDVDDGDTTPGHFSLREAMRLAHDQLGADQIMISPTLKGTITLNGTPLPSIIDDLIITGPGANNLTISGNDQTRIFTIDSQSAVAASVHISGLTLSHGSAVSDRGGAIYNKTAYLTLDQMVIRDSTATRSGGAICNLEGYLTITNSALINNSSNFGGGIAMVQDTVQNPLPTLSGYNVTIANNSAGLNGGGVYVREGYANLINFTIVRNHANTSADPLAEGGGVYVLDSFFKLTNTIVAANYNGTGTTVFDDVNTGSLVQRSAGSSYNIIGNAASADNLADGQNGNIVGVNGTGTRGIYSILRAANPQTTSTGVVYYAPLPGSPAIDAGSNALFQGGLIASDIRGRLRNLDGNSDGVSRTDIGAFETVPPNISLPADPTIEFNEGGAAKILSNSIYPLDSDKSGYFGGSLRVISSTSSDTYRLTIKNQGTAAGKIGVSGANVTYGGVVFATFTGGIGVTPLVVQFGAGINTPKVAALMKSIMFQAVGDAPRSGEEEATRIEFQLTDSSGATSNGAEVPIRINLTNDAPLLSTASSPSLTGINSTAGIAVSSLLTGITDPDGAVRGGLAIATADSTFSGNWQYSLNNGANWVDFGTISKSAALLLPDVGVASRIRFVRTSGTAPLTIKLGYYAWDQSQGVIGSKVDLTQASKHGGSGAYSINFRNSSATI